MSSCTALKLGALVASDGKLASAVIIQPAGNTVGPSEHHHTSCNMLMQMQRGHACLGVAGTLRQVRLGGIHKCWRYGPSAVTAGTSRKYLRGPRGIGFLYARNCHIAGRTDSSSSSSGKDMAGWEPAMIDIHGAEWLGPDSYRLVDSAEQYEQYELNFASKVSNMTWPRMNGALLCT